MQAHICTHIYYMHIHTYTGIRGPSETCHTRVMKARPPTNTYYNSNIQGVKSSR